MAAAMEVGAEKAVPAEVLEAARSVGGLGIACSQDGDCMSFDLFLTQDPSTKVTLADWPESVAAVRENPQAWLEALGNPAALSAIDSRSHELAERAASLISVLAGNLGIAHGNENTVERRKSMAVGSEGLKEPIEVPRFLRDAAARLGGIAIMMEPAGGDTIAVDVMRTDCADERHALLTVDADMLQDAAAWPGYLYRAQRVYDRSLGDAKLSDHLSALAAAIERDSAADLGLMEGEKTWLSVSTYADNGRLAISIECDEGPYSGLTVNLLGTEGLPEDVVFIDHNLPGDIAQKILGILNAERISGLTVPCGFLDFQGYRIDAGALVKLAPCCFDELPEALQDMADAVDDIRQGESIPHAAEQIAQAASAAADLGRADDKAGVRSDEKPAKGYER